jgi:glycosyltransferase involved in cell wall biosynthesis
MDITIGIPTFHRPESLARVLQHLCSFKAVPDEVVIGDNSGTCSAAGVVDSFRGKFKSLVYLGRPTNVGAFRNYDSIARVGTASYVYILSDDDFVYEGALVAMKNILASRSSVVAVNGGYEGTRQGVIGLDRDFGNATASIIPKGNYELLWNHIQITDSHPLMRRVDFCLHAQHRAISCAVAPSIFDLLGYGDFVHLDVPILQHEQRSDSISARIASQEVTDMANSDLEIVSCKANLLGPDGATVRGRVVRNVYFQGARMLFSSGKYLTGWHSLMRSHAYEGVGPKAKVWVEKNILPQLIAERLVQIAADTGCASVVSQEADISVAWVGELNAKLQAHPDRVPADGQCWRQLVLTMAFDVLPKRCEDVIVSIPSLVSQYSLSGYLLEVDASGNALRIGSRSQNWVETDTTNDIQILALQSPYA